MRNWNVGMSRRKKKSLQSFHSTYEELKLEIYPENCTKIQGFHSTYEELKLSMVYVKVYAKHRFSFYLWGIETKISIEKINIFIGFHSTYEELKRILSKKGG